MDVKDVKDLLDAISQTLTAIKEFPVFEEVIEDGSYYTMSDLTLGDAIQAVNEINCGIEAVNSPDLCLTSFLTPKLKEAIISLSAIGTSIVRFDATSRPSEMKAAAMDAARQDGHDVSGVGVVFDQKAEEIPTGYDLDAKYKYLCFYHKTFPFMKDSWGFDCSDSKEELLKNQYPLFSPRDVSERSNFDETFRLVLDAIATDPQILLCSDGEYRIYQYAGSGWNWVSAPTRFTKDLWKKLSSQYRWARNAGTRMQLNTLALDDAQFALAQRLIRVAFDDEIDTHEMKDEF